MTSISATNVSTASGLYRIRLEEPQSREWLEFYIPLDASRRLNANEGGLWLGKALWQGDEYLFELEESDDRLCRIVWAGDYDDSMVELSTVPLRVGLRVRLFDTEDRGAQHWDYAIVEKAKT